MFINLKNVKILRNIILCISILILSQNSSHIEPPLRVSWGPLIENHYTKCQLWRRKA